MKYTELERNYIKNELKRLETSRGDTYPVPKLTEWISSFEEEGFTAEHACKMIRQTKITGNVMKVKFSDFVDCFEEAMKLKPIIPVKQLPTPKLIEENTSNLLNRVREELGISYIDFLLEAKQKGYTPDEWFEQLKADPKLTGCTRLEDKAREQRKITTLAEAIKNNF